MSPTRSYRAMVVETAPIIRLSDSFTRNSSTRFHY